MRVGVIVEYCTFCIRVYQDKECKSDSRNSKVYFSKLGVSYKLRGDRKIEVRCQSVSIYLVF